MHIETCFYIRIRIPKALPIDKPPPDFARMAKTAEDLMVDDNQWIEIAERNITVGAPRPTGVNGPYYWDNEMPERQCNVQPFYAKARGITIGEYAWYMWKNDISDLPASWEYVLEFPVNGHHAKESRGVYEVGESRSVPAAFLHNKCVLTAFGLQPLTMMLSHPFMGSYDEVNGYALFVGGRIPTREEEQSIYAQVEDTKAKVAENYQTANVSAVNG